MPSAHSSSQEESQGREDLAKEKFLSLRREMILPKYTEGISGLSIDRRMTGKSSFKQPFIAEDGSERYQRQRRFWDIGE
jgi:hypothetical protein